MSTPVVDREERVVDAAGDAGNGKSALDGMDRGPISRFIWRARLAATCVLLTGLTFIQSPGEVAADTKLDLSQDPLGLMTRALNMWDPSSFSGTLQNQAYGYLWPMGPFFWLGDMSGLPAWAVQRLWWALLLSVAFLGMVRLIRVLDLGPPLARYLAALAYALSPMLLAKLGPISSEVLPIAMAPWVLIPLVYATSGRSLRRYAAASGLAVFMIGGVNAVATVAVLPLGLLWILTRERSREKWQLLGWWVLSVFLACLWWLVPLLLLGRYSPPFLDWIESASVTTIVSDPFSVIRGTSDWLGSLSTSTGPVWWMGWLFVTNLFLVLASAALATVGLAGIALRPPNAIFIVLSALTGFLLLGIGHDSVLSGVGAQGVRDLLDGPLAPLRNLHKFDPVLRVALVLGIAWFITRALDRFARRRSAGPEFSRGWWRAAAPLGVVVVALAVTVAGVATGPMTKNRNYLEIPQYWQEAAAWLQEQPGDGKALVVPGASFADFRWGRTQDEPFQVLGDISWDVRDAVPLGNAGHTRLLDGIAEALEAGRPNTGLQNVLERSGFQWLVVRNDIGASSVGNWTNERVNATIAQMRGITEVATFGPEVADLAPGGYVANYGVGAAAPAVAIFEVGSALDSIPAVLRDAQQPVVLAGGAESLVETSEAGVVTDGTVVYQGSPGASLLPGLLVATDSLRRNDVDFGKSRNNRGNTMTAADEYLIDRRTHDYFARGQQAQTVAELVGVSSVTASSSAAWADSLVARDASAQPWAALDGDPSTAWITGSLGSPVGQWWRVDFDSARQVGAVTIDLWQSPAAVKATQIQVATDNVVADVDVRDKTRVRVPLKDPSATFVKVTLTGTAPGSGSPRFGLAEVQIPGVNVSRPLRINAGAPASAAVLAQAGGARSQCILVGQRFRCAAEIGRAGEESAGIDRWVRLAAGKYRFQLGASGRPGAALDSLLQPEKSVIATVSSQDIADPSGRGQAVSDLDGQTTWVASRIDDLPTIRLRLPQERRITGVRFVVPNDVAVSAPIRVRVTAQGRSYDALVNRDTGVAAIPPTRTRNVEVQILATDTLRSLTDGVITSMPVGVTELQLLGAQDLQRGIPRSFVSEQRCGFAPQISVNGKVTSTQGSLTIGELLTGATSTLDSCGPNAVRQLPEGWYRIVAKPTASIAVDWVSVLPESGVPTPTTATNPGIEKWTASSRVVNVDSASTRRTLETYESFNPGWRASLGDSELVAVEVDGWRQGWIVPAGAGGVVEMTYQPNALYQLGLGLGALAVVLLIGIVAIPVRRGSGRRALLEVSPLRITAVLGVLVATLTVGLAGALAATVVAGVIAVTRRRRLAVVVVVVLMALATAIEVVFRWPDSRGEPAFWTATQAVLVVSSLLVAVVGVVGPEFLRRQRDQTDGP